MIHKRVLKFGGAALADGEAVRRVCRIIASQVHERPIVVVSAHQGVTDLLERVARVAAGGGLETDPVRIRHRTLLRQLGLDAELLDRHLRELFSLLDTVRERGHIEPSQLDFALSFGERMSVRIVARVLQEMGVGAMPVDAYDLGFTTDSKHGEARPLEGIDKAIRSAMEQIPGVAVVTGFLAKDRYGNLTTLGRNGSDLTASVIAEAVGAQEIQFWKSVSGIMTADPELVAEAQGIERLSFGEAAEFAFHGGTVLHPAAVAPAVRGRIAVRVCNVREPSAPGTILDDRVQRSGPAGVAAKRAVLRIDYPIEQPESRGEQLALLFRTLEDCGLTPGPLVSCGKGISVVVDDVRDVGHVLHRLPGATITRDLASVALIGQDIGRNMRAGSRAHLALEEAGIEVLQAFLGDRELSQAFLVRRGDLQRAARLLHGLVLSEVLAG